MRLAKEGDAVWRGLRDAAWLHGNRARAYAWIFATLMWLGLVYHWVSLVLGHNIDEAASEPGKQGPSDFLAFWLAGRLALAGHAATVWSLDTLGPQEHAVAVLDPTEVGVPLMVDPVSVSPAGRAPELTETVGVGFPPTLKVNE